MFQGFSAKLQSLPESLAARDEAAAPMIVLLQYTNHNHPATINRVIPDDPRPRPRGSGRAHTDCRLWIGIPPYWRCNKWIVRHIGCHLFTDFIFVGWRPRQGLIITL